MSMNKLPTEYVERMNRTFEAHERKQSESSGARVSFHEKLAVLTAGSLALAVSGFGAIYQKPLQDAVAMHRLFLSLEISVILLWLSLIASVVHNLIESRTLASASEADFADASPQLVRRGMSSFDAIEEFSKIEPRVKSSFDAIKEEFSKLQPRVEKLFAEYQDHYFDNYWRLRAFEGPLSIAAVSLFVLGYLSVVVYVIVLVNGKH
jgi:ABC-type multidrug transport system fused ATPase/permease subunit